jgi:basic membrane lipoprotein Med (substrate-binding protein (PBP1-ABC) superfamily)
MRIRSTGLVLFAGLTLIVGACTGGGAASSAPASEAAPSESAAASEAVPSESASASAATSDLKIGVVTDVGTVNDKNFNEYTYNGAKEGAAAIGAAEPPVVVPTSDADYEPMLQSFVDQGYQVIVATGFNLVPATTKLAKENPDIWFIGVDHAPCIDAEGVTDPTFACAGTKDLGTLLPKYIALNYAEDQAGYLAGMVAASASKSGIIGAVGGVSLCGPCVRYMQGYVLGAKSINPDIQVKTAWVSESDFKVGFADQAAGKTFGDQFIQQNEGLDVLFQVAGLTGNGLIDAACAAGINAVGVDVDQYQSYPASQPCILTSAEKHLAVSVSNSIQQIADGTAKGGLTFYNATNDGIGASAFYEAASKLPADMQTKVDEAVAGIAGGTITTCPPAPDCGKTGIPIGD